MSDTYTVSGEIIEIYDIQIVSDNFKKREFILKHAPNPEYPDFLKLEVVQNKTDLLDKYKVGQHVEVEINLKGKKWEKGEKSGYFNSLQAWRIQPASQVDSEPW